MILENNSHLIARSDNLSKEISSFKSWTAKQLSLILKEQGATRVLAQLAFFKKAHKKYRTYQVWEEGSHPQLIKDEMMMQQKIEYIHHNPVKRGYVERAEYWRCSSAGCYAGKDGLLVIDKSWFV